MPINNPPPAQNAILQSLLTTRGDIVYRNATVAARLAKGASGEVLAMGADDPAWVVAPSSFTAAITEVFNGTSPSAWTDLDLSAVVGSNYALVMLKVKSGGNVSYAAFRQDGDTEPDFPGSVADNDMMGVSRAFLPDSVGYRYVWVLTSAAGIVEWISKDEDAGTTIDVVAYIK